MKVASQQLSQDILRCRKALVFAAPLLAAFSLVRAIVFMQGGIWSGAAIQFVALCVSVWTVWLVRQGSIRYAALWFHSFAMLELTVLCLFQDLHDMDAPRTVHLYFIPVGFATALFLLHEKPWLRALMSAWCCAAFTFFSTSYWGIYTELLARSEHRATLGWINAIIATVLVYLMLQIFRTKLNNFQPFLQELRKAIPKNQLRLYYQPQATADGHISGAEALIRWQHPTLGMVPPAEFIPLAEESGLILPIGSWVIETACQQLVTWSLNPQTAHLVLAINVSAQQFKQADFVPDLLAVLTRTGANPKRLKLELTESSLVNDVDDIIAKMQVLKTAGMLISLDDFGTGYSSLTYLKRLPLDQLKIDKSFVDDITTSEDALAIARTIINLGKSMNLEVIAEGVETDAQCQLLASLGCPNYQGYLLSKPLPIDAFDTLLFRNAEEPSGFAMSVQS